MARRTIVVDDLTDQEIDGVSSYVVTGTVSINVAGSEDIKTYDVSWEVAGNTAESFRDLFEHNDLATFIGRLRPLVKVNTVDSDVVRKWVKANHPEIQVAERGRLGAEIMALYRREGIAKSDAPDTAAK